MNLADKIYSTFTHFKIRNSEILAVDYIYDFYDFPSYVTDCCAQESVFTWKIKCHKS